MTISLATARTAFLQMLNAIEPRLPSQQVTSALGTSTTAQINSLGYRPDNSFKDTHWLVLPNGPTGSGSLEVGAVSAFDQDSGSGATVVSVHEAFSAAVASGVAAYLSPLHPEDVRRVLNDAAGMVYPDVFAQRRFSHVTGSRVFNGFFDVWSAGLPLWWEKSNAALTVTQLTNPWAGIYGVRLVADGAAARTLNFLNPYPALLNELAGADVTLHAMIRTSAGSSGGLTIKDGNGAGTAVYHTGDGEWQEVVTAATAIERGSEANPIQWQLNVATGQTVDFGPVWTEGGPRQTEIPQPPDWFKAEPAHVRELDNAWPTTKRGDTVREGWDIYEVYPSANISGDAALLRVLRFSGGLVSLRQIDIVGRDYISQATAETDVYELDPPRDRLLYTWAGYELKKSEAQLIGSGGAGLEAQLSRDWQAEYKELRGRQGMAVTPPPVSVGPGLGPPGGYGRIGPDDR